MITTPVNTLMSAHEAAILINQGASLSIAGAEHLLDLLPPGNWIGGTSSYFISEAGGIRSNKEVFVSSFPAEAKVTFSAYSAPTMRSIVDEAPENGYSLAIVPTKAEALEAFSRDSRFWPEIFLKPIVGWVAGIDLTSKSANKTAYVYLGLTRQKFSNHMVAAHVSLPPPMVASIETVNIFEPDRAHSLRFQGTQTTVSTCSVDGRDTDLYSFLEQQGALDGRRPLVGDFSGAHINVSIQACDQTTRSVSLFAPVFGDVTYHLAQPVSDFEARFAAALGDDGTNIFSCNCILNFLHGAMEGKANNSFKGPVTFGEIAYLLHNQTMVVLRVS